MNERERIGLREVRASAAGSYLEIFENMVKSIPGAHAAEEFVTSTKQLVTLWARRRV